MVTAAFDVLVSVNFIRKRYVEGGSDKNAENLCQHYDHSSLYFYLETESSILPAQITINKDGETLMSVGGEGLQDCCLSDGHRRLRCPAFGQH